MISAQKLDLDIADMQIPLQCVELWGPQIWKWFHFLYSKPTSIIFVGPPPPPSNL